MASQPHGARSRRELIAADGREQFWTELVSQYTRRIRSYLARTRCSDDQIDEIVWDVWAMAIDHEEELMAVNDAWPLVHALTKQAWAARRRDWRHEYPVVETAFTNRADPARWSSAACDWSVRALATLPDKQRQAVDLRYRWNWPFWAIAAALNTAEITVRVTVSRGLGRLRELPPPPAREDAARGNAGNRDAE